MSCNLIHLDQIWCRCINMPTFGAYQCRRPTQFRNPSTAAAWHAVANLFFLRILPHRLPHPKKTMIDLVPQATIGDLVTLVPTAVLVNIKALKDGVPQSKVVPQSKAAYLNMTQSTWDTPTLTDLATDLDMSRNKSG